MFLLIPHTETSNGAESAAAVCVASGGDSGGSDGRVVKEVEDSVTGLLWLLLHLDAGLSTAITDGSGVDASMSVIAWLTVLNYFLSQIFGNISKLVPFSSTDAANCCEVFLMSFLGHFASREFPLNNSDWLVGWLVCLETYLNINI